MPSIVRKEIEVYEQASTGENVTDFAFNTEQDGWDNKFVINFTKRVEAFNWSLYDEAIHLSRHVTLFMRNVCTDLSQRVFANITIEQNLSDKYLYSTGPIRPMTDGHLAT